MIIPRIYISSLGFLIYSLFLSDEGPTLETLDFAFYIGSTPTFLYFDSTYPPLSLIHP